MLKFGRTNLHDNCNGYVETQISNIHETGTENFQHAKPPNIISTKFTFNMRDKMCIQLKFFKIN